MVEVVVVAVVGNSKTDSATLGSNKEGAIMPTKSKRREDPPGEESPAGSPPKRQRVDGGGPSSPSPKAVDDKRGEGAAGSGPCLRCAGCGANDDGRAPLLLFDDPEEDQEAAAGDRKADREERR